MSRLKAPSAIIHSPRLYGEIQAELRERGLTQQELATRLDRHLNTVNQAIANGRNQATLRAVVDFLGIKVKTRPSC